MLSLPGNRATLCQPVDTGLKLAAFLLQADSTQRLGSLAGGAQDIKDHPWFHSINWQQLELHQLPAPFIPTVYGPQDSSNFEDYSNTPPLQHAFMLTPEQQQAFQDF